MTAATVTPTTARQTSPYKVTFGHLINSEWIKIRSVRSTWWTAASTVAVMVLFGVMMAFQQSSEAGDVGNTDPGANIMVLTFGFLFGQLAVAVLGALSITGEYSTGMIRSTLSAAPTRLPALAAKTLVTTLLTAVITLVAVVVTYLLTLPILSGKDMVPDLGSSTVQKSLLGLFLYMMLVAVLSVGVGTIIRHSAGSIFTLVALLFVLFVVSSFFSQQWAKDVFQFIPINLGASLMWDMGSEQGVTALSWGPALLVMIAWAGAALVGGAVLLKRRDA